MKNHYQLFDIDPGADEDTIKRAFRREIAKYHPDKVMHLAAEFQQMALVRASELTAAYKILSDPALRAGYDDALRDGREFDAAAPSRTPRAAATGIDHSAATEQRIGEPVADSHFERDRAGRDDIVRRAMLFRIRAVLRATLGECDMPELRGFDVACIPRPTQGGSLRAARLFSRPTQYSLLARLVDRVDGDALRTAYRLAHETRGALSTDAVVLFVIGNRMAAAAELAPALDAVRRELARSLDKIFAVPVDGRDWTAKIPLNAPPIVRAVADRLRSTG